MRQVRYPIIRGHGEGEQLLSRFSINQGGLFFALEKRLSLFSRTLTFVAIAWMPVAILDGIFGSGTLISRTWVNIPLLVAGPLLIIAEAPIALRIGLAIEQLQTRDILRDPHRLTEILARARRALSGALGILLELGILAYVAFVAYRRLNTLDPRQAIEGVSLTARATLAAADWFTWISLPMVLFLRLRWVWRGIVWVQTLWRISRIPMSIHPTHTDQRGGLAILGRAQESFGLFWLAASALAATTIAYRVSSGLKPLHDYYVVIVAIVAVEVLITLLPLLFFLPTLRAAKIRGVADYESLSSRYSRGFDPRWMDPTKAEKDLLGNADFQSLADLGNGYDRVSKMGIFPANLENIKRLAVLGALPFLPLALLIFSAKQLAKAALQLVF